MAFSYWESVHMKWIIWWIVSHISSHPKWFYLILSSISIVLRSSLIFCFLFYLFFCFTAHSPNHPLLDNTYLMTCLLISAILFKQYSLLSFISPLSILFCNLIGFRRSNRTPNALLHFNNQLLPYFWHPPSIQCLNRS